MAINSNGAKWGPQTLGTNGGTVTWQFDASFDALAATGRAPVNVFMAAVQNAFALWESFANIDFQQVSSSAAAQIDVGAAAFDGPNGTLGQANWLFYDKSPLDQFVSASVNLDQAETWNVVPASPLPNAYDVFAVAMHEIGHAIGLDHSADPNSLMYYQLNDQRGPASIDRAAIQEIYGARPFDATPDTEAAGSPSQDVFRFYNETTRTHFYTNSTAERDQVLARLPQFRFEGNAFDTVNSNDSDAIDVYRFYNQRTQTHFYTASAAERDEVMRTLPQFRFEGVGYKASATDGGGEFDALYRFYNTETGTHFYTTNEEEMITVLDTLPQYRYEGISAFVDFA
ncbi:matrixin family metalloprotease [Aureimonas pseudogalii]|uniref:Peptidase metallopeptidase domain-containing protein n=1 Tax=Aureimonas pseudogalii TaxID=1744844 RepID=A0A7W6EGX6_9HYPH|nr:matrixin family metalloprotease [Aureimonas pseudogalii]MBB3997814.1 hypothetical protein [Aureimonas pseudogalii]